MKAASAWLAAAMVAIAGGCAGSKPSSATKPAGTASSGSTGTSGAATTSAGAFDAVAVSQLREKALETLTRAATCELPQLRGNSLEGLAPAPTRLEPLLALGLKDPNIGVRSVAATMVGRLKIETLAASVKPLLSDESAFVHGAAIYALSRCGEQVDATPLSWMVLNDPSVKVRSQAAWYLGEMGDPSARGLLTDAARRTVPRALPVEVRLLQLQIAEALVKLGDDSQLEAVRAALYPSRPEDLEATALAVQILGLVGDRGAVDELIYLTAYKDKEGQQMPAEIRLGAAQSLARLGHPQGAFIADEFLKNDSALLRAQAASVYGEIGGTANLGKLESLLNERNGLVQVTAAAAILKATEGKGLKAAR